MTTAERRPNMRPRRPPLSAARRWAVIFFGALLMAACQTQGDRRDEPSPARQRSAQETASLPPRTTFPMPPISDPRDAEKEAAIETTFTRLDDRRLSLADYRGHVLVLDFYATWCPPCRDSVPHLNALQKKFQADGLRVIGLNVGGPEDREALPAFIEEYGIQYDLGFPTEEMADLYLSDNNSIPQAFVIDRQGRLVKRFIGYDNSLSAVMDDVVRRALAAPAD